MKKILETLKQKFMNKFFWNLQIETVVPSYNFDSQDWEYLEIVGAPKESSKVIYGTYLITCKSEDLKTRLELLTGNKFLLNRMAMSGIQWPPYNRQDEVKDFNEKLKICFDIDFLSDKRWTRRYYVKLG